jgi:C1A family cysteine protease
MSYTHNPLNFKGAAGLYGYKPDCHDKSKDKLYGADEHTQKEVIASLSNLAATGVVDLRDQPQAPIYDQGQLGSCTANATAAMLSFVEGKEGNTPEQLSRLFIYRRARKLEGTIDTDSGATLADTLLGIAEKGAPLESDWPYDVTKFADLAPPEVWGQAWGRIAGFDYFRLTSLSDMKACLDAGYPFVFGIQVYDSFESQTVADTGMVPMPNVELEQCLGGHALCCMGYSNAMQAFLVRNSWGQWGINGYCWIPYAYLSNPALSSDFWTVRKIQK